MTERRRTVEKEMGEELIKANPLADIRLASGMSSVVFG
jgi:hypothetical protein